MKNFMNLPAFVIDELSVNEMLQVSGGAGGLEMVTNSGSGVCAGENNGNGHCEVLNNGTGRCICINSGGGSCGGVVPITPVPK